MNGNSPLISDPHLRNNLFTITKVAEFMDLKQTGTGDISHNIYLTILYQLQ